MKLSVLRGRIDRIDAKLVRLLNLRTRVALDIGAIKRQQSLAVYSPGREREVFARVAALNRGPLRPNSLRAIYREIMSAALSLEKPIKVAYMGQASCMAGHAAAFRFGGSVRYLPCPTVRAVFHDVESGRADYGVVEAESSGRCGAALLACLAETPLKICSEIRLGAESGVGGRAGHFLVLGGNGAEATGDDVTCVLATGKAGDALLSLAARMKRQGLLVTIRGAEARNGRSGRIRLLVEMKGHVTDKRVGKALDALTGGGARLNILGSYPKSRDI